MDYDPGLFPWVLILQLFLGSEWEFAVRAKSSRVPNIQLLEGLWTRWVDSLSKSLSAHGSSERGHHVLQDSKKHSRNILNQDSRVSALPQKDKVSPAAEGPWGTSFGPPAPAISRLSGHGYSSLAGLLDPQ